MQNNRVSKISGVCKLMKIIKYFILILMFVFITCCSCSSSLGFQVTAKVSPPEFQTNNETNNTWVDDTFKDSINFKANNDKKATRKEFVNCAVSIKGCTFSNNVGFGVSTSIICGGAVYAADSSIQISDNTKFESNCAGVGGAIALLLSQMIMSNTEFSKNTAFKYAGALYVQGKEKAAYSLQCTSCTFQDNNGAESGGAVLLTVVNDAAFLSCKFISNTARLTGGAVQAYNSQTYFIQCRFEKNTIRKRTGTIKDKKYDTVVTGLRARGGGAICFLSGDLKSPSGDELGHTRVLLSTQECCFTDNSVDMGINYDFAVDRLSPSHNILFEGRPKWDSIKDTMDASQNYVGEGSRYWINNHVSISKVPRSGDDPNCKPTKVTSSPAVIFIPTPRNDAKESKTSYIPTPTVFTYQATQVTRPPPQKNDEEKPGKVDPKPKSDFTPFSKSFKLPQELTHTDNAIMTQKTHKEINVPTTVNTSVPTYIIKDGTKSSTYFYTNIVTYFKTYTETVTIIIVAVNEQNHEVGGLPALQFIILFVLGFIALLALAVMAVFLWRLVKNKDNDSEDLGEEVSDPSTLGQVQEKIVEDPDGQDNENLKSFDEDTSNMGY